MGTKEAIANRILQLCDERGIAVNELANISDISPSTVYSILNEKAKILVLLQLKSCVMVSISH